MEINKVLHEIQKSLKVPKERRNSFGNYNFRNCEDIVEAVKKILPENAAINISDEIIMMGDRFYVKAIVSLLYGGERITSCGYAREALERKGMDSGQLTGATSSYARKYALCGLFAIDDGVDADSMDNTEKPKAEVKQVKKVEAKPETPQGVYDRLVAAINKQKSMGELNKFLLTQSVKDAMDKLYLDDVNLSDKLADLVASKNETFATVI